MTTYSCDCVIIGAGHAGCEAALAAANLGLYTIILNLNSELIASISCNPSVGGIGKSHIVKEIDALGGFQAQVTDMSAIQYKVLNYSKGPAVWALRAQIDKYLYSMQYKKILQSNKNISIFHDCAHDLIIKKNKIQAIITERGNIIKCQSAVICTGTFLNGKIHIGKFTSNDGRLGEKNSPHLSGILKAYGLTRIRLKTGTPARIDKNSIDFSKLAAVSGDSPDMFFSWNTNTAVNNSVPCHIAYTTNKTKNIIIKHKADSPLYNGSISGIGPRYCPSIDDKIFRFADKERHQLFLEPESLNTNEIYVNGFSTSMPENVQLKLLHSVSGLEDAVIIRPAYAVEYDCFNPIQLHHTLESKLINKLFFAGQINGTSGYEEAAGQGIIAGINMYRAIHKKVPFILSPQDSYIGLMIHDLTTKGITEPYRMFTARAENRLYLRMDNADDRLFTYNSGLYSKAHMKHLRQKCKQVSQLNKLFFSSDLDRHILAALKINSFSNRKVSYICTRTELNISQLLKELQKIFSYSKAAIATTVFNFRYAGYIKKQNQYTKSIHLNLDNKIPDDINYSLIAGLKKEAIQVLEKNKTQTGTIKDLFLLKGVSSSDIEFIFYYLKHVYRK